MRSTSNPFILVLCLSTSRARVRGRVLLTLQQRVDERMDYYNEQRRHSSIDYLAPLTYLQQARAASSCQGEGS